MRLPRPYVPLRVRIEVAERHYHERFGCKAHRVGPLGEHLRFLLAMAFSDESVHLHHRPALCNRERKNGHYVPDANDPDYLVYLPVDDHDVETRVRGQRGQHSDLALRRKRKRVERKATRPKRKWPKRKLRWSPSRSSSSSSSR